VTILASAPVSRDADLSTVDTTDLAHAASAHLNRVQTAWNRELHPSWCQNQFAVGCGVHDSVVEWTQATGGDLAWETRDISWPAVGVSAHMDGSGEVGVALYLEGAKHATDIIDVILTPTEVGQLVAALQRAGVVASADPQMATRPPMGAEGGVSR
jgi:hypothetical protein